MDLANSKVKEELTRIKTEVAQQLLKRPGKKPKIEQCYTIRQYVFDIMEAGFTEEYRSTKRMTNQKAKRGRDLKTPMKPGDVKLIISESKEYVCGFILH